MVTAPDRITHTHSCLHSNRCTQFRTLEWQHIAERFHTCTHEHTHCTRTTKNVKSKDVHVCVCVFASVLDEKSHFQIQVMTFRLQSIKQKLPYKNWVLVRPQQQQKCPSWMWKAGYKAASSQQSVLSPAVRGGFSARNTGHPPRSNGIRLKREPQAPATRTPSSHLRE